MIFHLTRSLLALALVAVLASCLSGGGGGSDAGTASGGTPPVTPPPTIVGTPIASIAVGAPDGQVTITVSGANPFVAGSVVTISGTAAYNGTYTIVSVTPTNFVIAAAEAGNETPASATAQSGGGLIPGCVTTVTAGAAGQINLSYAPSRLVGVAPLAIVFDATTTTRVGMSKPFHELDYTWGFGDGGSGTWVQGARPGSSRNSAKGPVAAHVFKTPGSYTISLSVSDGVNTVSNSCVQIAVQSPDVIFAGTNTICFGNTPGGAGCPAGASTPVGTNDFDVAIASCTTGKRCLFKGGDTFISNADGNISTAGPITIGSYGTGKALITSSTNVDIISLSNNAVSDIRIMDLDMAGNGTTIGKCIGVGSSPTTGLTVLGVNCHNIGKGIIMSDGAKITDSIVQESYIYGIMDTNGIFGWAVNSAYLDNRIENFDTAAEHGIRLQPGQKVTISNNSITKTGSNHQILTVRAAEHDVPCIGAGCSNTSPPAGNPATADTQFIYISDNKFEGGLGGNQQLFQVGPASNTQRHYIFDVVAERNWMIFGSNTQDGHYGTSRRLTIRNNICNAPGGAADRTCFKNDYTNTADPTFSMVPDDNWFYNNTCYSGNASNNFICVNLAASNPAHPSTNNVVKNNLAYSSAAVTFGPQVVRIAAGVTVANASGNSTDLQAASVDPLWANTSTLFNTPSDFKPTGASYAIGSNNACPGGVPCSVSTGVPVLFDFLLAPQPAIRDMGAVNH